jgi:hypothetical protein
VEPLFWQQKVDFSHIKWVSSHEKVTGRWFWKKLVDISEAEGASQ